nr:unnamed protein product [Callosobruchus chinensis]
MVHHENLVGRYFTGRPKSVCVTRVRLGCCPKKPPQTHHGNGPSGKTQLRRCAGPVDCRYRCRCRAG